MPPITYNRIVGAGIGSFMIFVFFFGTFHHSSRESFKQLTEAAQSSASQRLCSPDSPVFSASRGFQPAVSSLFETIKHSLTAPDYTDAYGETFKLEHDTVWREPLGSNVLIIDMDTRSPDGKNEVLGPNKLNWETATGKEGGGMLSASFMNHFLYAQIHGYDYKFFKAESLEPEGLHNTWIKPFVMGRFLQDYQFVVFVDADATIQHLEVPLEWLFNRWGIGRNTSVAMPIDTMQILDGNKNASCDSKGRVTLNTGFVVAQSLPLTFEMMEAWKTCPDENRYKGCGHWKKNWSHEQRAFSEYIRYDFNPDGTNIVEIPCDDAMGYPGLHEKAPHIISDCHGQFVRHHTVDKAMTKNSTDIAMLQAITQTMQSTLKYNRNSFMIDEKKSKSIF
ncbi:hypothetical protein P280DRAFT_147453 [Massarina eburnea CBS 473.64]|uniref:Nucleotide-diphospho-sugar transferase domain-containing protein n=1 Tax=Massarina eburnea CBS 473.64 TaxID=1395130 RepID=A0A6A6RNC2_9PLEO|nr:hypothetical protein P280DRAFT_147453 [Massarina eburnea CBS 473.64]